MSRQIRERINLGLATASLLSAATLLLAFGCSGSGEPKSSLVHSGGCDPALDADCGSVGASCVANDDCATGSCASGACVSLAPDCLGGDCGPNNGGSGGSNGEFMIDDPDLGGTAGSEATCVDLDVDFQRVTPTVMLLIDQSGSMSTNFEDGKDRWETLEDTLTDPQDSLLKKLDTSVRFGMSLYTSDGGFGDDEDNPKTCPVLRNVDIALGNFSEISDMLEDNGPQGSTPTAESVTAMATKLRAFREEGPKSIILATDGEPDTCADPDADQGTQGQKDAARAGSVAAVRAAYGDGIQTHIISVGGDVGASHLKALAVAGAGDDPNAEAYAALDTDALVAAFNAIIGSVRTCDFTLEGTVEADNAERGTVVLDGQSLTFGDPNGWEMPDDKTVRLLGQACERAQANASAIQMKFPCDAIQIIPR
jgi:hypothetical protein